ncbi:twin-arginine translocase TatA/TatE family subunit [Endozoicomonas sp. SM1973]|uniref:Sec-independent protein translocase protein TatA n=1 Tax=Spartinivicinus marinus TaxID=2994442 RepID=A0A853IAK3_9GAMM|nr:twin-arginine translocase TatA/TatE family subunit [Spartinivicinus marinus]MCX4026499.1 twin-arginine translocase TatA/TatE family subunit [Spartinivicinus marinus]NYZ66871.1 twin-arginine translocase TatA/TatE family subunit [Spartinivicinus marinus]
MFGISVPQLIIILVIVLLIFGGKRLRSLGGDLGSFIKGFKKAVSDEDSSSQQQLDKPNGEKPLTDQQQAKQSENK